MCCPGESAARSSTTTSTSLSATTPTPPSSCGPGWRSDTSGAEILADTESDLSYRVRAREETFLRYRGRIYRKNEIWRSAISKRTGTVVHEELLKQNCALVKYTPDRDRIVDIVD